MDRYVSFPGLKVTPSALLRVGTVPAHTVDLVFPDYPTVKPVPQAGAGTRTRGSVSLNLSTSIAPQIGLGTRSRGSASISMSLSIAVLTGLGTRTRGSASLSLTSNSGIHVVINRVTRSGGSVDVRLISAGARLGKAHATLLTQSTKGRIL